MYIKQTWHLIIFAAGVSGLLRISFSTSRHNPQMFWVVCWEDLTFNHFKNGGNKQRNEMLVEMRRITAEFSVKSCGHSV